MRTPAENKKSSALRWPGRYREGPDLCEDHEMRVVFIDVRGVESKLPVRSSEGSENSVRNEQDIECVQKLYVHLIRSLIESKDVMILTQYRAQMKGIKQNLNLDDSGVITVFSSQGGEWDYVILSTVRSIPEYNINPKPTDGWLRKYLGFIKQF